MQGETLTVTTPDGDFQALVRRPIGLAGQTAPAVVLIQEIFGVNAVMRYVADQLAAQGYIAVVPDLFWRFEPGIELDDHKPDELQKAFALFPEVDVDAAVSDVAATIAVVREMEGCDGKVGAVGYCLGGLLAFLTATRTDADVVVSYYGVNIDKFTGEATKIAHPIMLHIAGADQFVPPEAQEKILADLGNDRHIEIHRYAGRDHAFARHDGDSYHAEDAQIADARTHAFLAANLKPAA